LNILYERTNWGKVLLFNWRIWKLRINWGEINFLESDFTFIIISTVIPKGNLTPEIIATIKYVSDPQISPDSNNIAFVDTEIDMNSSKNYSSSNIWIVPTDGSEKPRKYTFSDKDEKMPRWFPDGKYLVFFQIMMMGIHIRFT